MIVLVLVVLVLVVDFTIRGRGRGRCLMAPFHPAAGRWPDWTL